MAIDSGFPAYRRYFLAKWKRSLRKKQRIFPDLYNFDGILHHSTCMALTEAIMPYYPEFGGYRDYFRRYTLTGDVLDSLALPVTDLHLRRRSGRRRRRISINCPKTSTSASPFRSTADIAVSWIPFPGAAGMNGASPRSYTRRQQA